MIVLNECQRDAGVRETAGVVGFHEEAAFITENLRLDDENALQRGLDYIQSARMIPQAEYTVVYRVGGHHATAGTCRTVPLPAA